MAAQVEMGSPSGPPSHPAPGHKPLDSPSGWAIAYRNRTGRGRG